MRIRLAINNHICDLHCPSCGGMVFHHPKVLKGFPEWNRCKGCGCDMRYAEDHGGIMIKAVMEDDVP
jgi:hypothetical protein